MNPGSTHSDCFALFEDNQRALPHARLLTGLVERIECDSTADAQAKLSLIEQRMAEGYWIAFAAHYELGHALEPTLHKHLRQQELLFRAWVFKDLQVLEGDSLNSWWQTRLAQLTPQQREAGLLDLAPSIEAKRYEDAVNRALDYIWRGDCYQVNLTFPLNGQSYGHPLALFAQLRDAQAVRYGALIGDHDKWILSRSPELFVERRGHTLTCKPMKGTAPRSADPSEDAEALRGLLASDKNRAENLMIVDLIRNDLGRLAPAGGVSVQGLFEPETYRSVHQLTSTIVAAPVDADLPRTMDALFPCGSITGAPKIRAMEIIQELEHAPRGLYCGALGWLAPTGDYAFNVPIRTLLVGPESSVRLDVGSGIVADSHPQDEWNECLSKARFAHQLIDNFQLIETLRYDAATRSVPLLERHLDRLGRSATALGFAWSRHGLHEQFQQHILGLTGAYDCRLRLRLARDGSVSIEHFRLDPTPTDVSVAIAPFKLDRRDPRLQHKTTARRFYDDALSEASLGGHFDVLFFNEENQLCEGARSNVFVERDGRLYTPAAHCGLLPGVLRQCLLDEGRAIECELYREDLQRADVVWIGNALRGLMRVARIEY